MQTKKLLISTMKKKSNKSNSTNNLSEESDINFKNENCLRINTEGTRHSAIVSFLSSYCEPTKKKISYMVDNQFSNNDKNENLRRTYSIIKDAEVAINFNHTKNSIYNFPDYRRSSFDYRKSSNKC